jgi:hypothetical protein
MDDLIRRLVALEAASSKDIVPSDPSLKKVLDPETYRLQARTEMSQAYLNQASHHESKLKGISLDSIESMKVLEFLSDLRIRCDTSGIVEEHAALVLPTLVNHPFVAGELATLTEKTRSDGGRATYLQLIMFLISTYVTEESLLTARQEFHAAKMLQGETVELFAARLRRKQVILQGAVSEDAIKKTLMNGLSPQLQLFSERLNVSSLSYAQIVASLSQTQSRMTYAGVSLGNAAASTSIMRRNTPREAPRQHSASIVAADQGTIVQDEPEYTVSLLTAEDMKSWICAGCRNFGHAAWLCPSLPEEVRLQSRDLRQQQIRRNNGKDPLNEFQSSYRMNPANQVPYRPPAFATPDSENAKGRADGRTRSQN